VQEYKYEMERLQREMADVKRRYFEQKRGGQLPGGAAAGAGLGEQQQQQQQDAQEQASTPSTGLATLAAKSTEVAVMERTAAGDAGELIPAMQSSGSVKVTPVAAAVAPPSSVKASPAASSPLSISVTAG
jgi:hypothetical protein